MGVKKYIEFEIKKASGWGYIAVVLIFLMASSYFLQFGISQYKHILEEKNIQLKISEAQRLLRAVYIVTL